MKNWFILLPCVFVLCLNAQVVSDKVQEFRDPDALKLLDKTAEHIQSLQTIQMTFNYLIEDKKEKTEFIQKGTLQLQGKKYILELLGTKVFYNGEKMWNYIESTNEASVTIPKASEMEFFFIDPMQIFKIYHEGFKISYEGTVNIQGSSLEEISLYPKDLKRSYYKVSIFIDNLKKQPVQIKAYGKDGIYYTVSINEFSELNMEDSAFTFNPKDYPKVEIIELF